MAKYSYEFKRKIVQKYLDGENSIEGLTKQYNIKSTNRVNSWLKAYKELGEEGLLRARQKKNFSFEFKLHAVKVYLSTEITYNDLAYSLGMKEPSVLVNWVSSYRRQGIDGLKPKRKGRRPKMRGKPKKDATPVSAESEKSLSKQIKDRLLYLEIENACLKELRKLRCQEEAQKKRQELSATSEDHLD